jgi:hypothetical protein
VIRPRGLLPPLVQQQLRGRMVSSLVLNLAISTQPGIDFLAHGGGGVAGFLLTLAGLTTAGVVPQWGEAAAAGSPVVDRGGRGWTLAAALSVAAMAGAVAIALAVGQPWTRRHPIVSQRVAVGEPETATLPRSWSTSCRSRQPPPS